MIEYIQKNPFFITDIITRAPKNKKANMVKRSLWDRCCSKLMHYNKYNIGKKLKAERILTSALEKTKLLAPLNNDETKQHLCLILFVF